MAAAFYRYIVIGIERSVRPALVARTTDRPPRRRDLIPHHRGGLPVQAAAPVRDAGSAGVVYPVVSNLGERP